MIFLTYSGSVKSPFLRLLLFFRWTVLAKIFIRSASCLFFNLLSWKFWIRRIIIRTKEIFSRSNYILRFTERAGTNNFTDQNLYVCPILKVFGSEQTGSIMDQTGPIISNHVEISRTLTDNSKTKMGGQQRLKWMVSIDRMRTVIDHWLIIDHWLTCKNNKNSYRKCHKHEVKFHFFLYCFSKNPLSSIWFVLLFFKRSDLTIMNPLWLLLRCSIGEF